MTHYFFKNQHSPAILNLIQELDARGWSQSSKNAIFSDASLDFHTEAAQHLEYKHLLSQLIGQHCPEVMPLCFHIHEKNWQDICRFICEKYEKECFTWILKPALQNNGQNIKILSSVGEIKRHFLSPGRLGGEHVLQQYIRRPHLLRDRRKYSIRMLVILSSHHGAYLYEQGYFNVSRYPYPENNYTSLAPHLTNEHLYGYEPNVWQIPSGEFPHYPALSIQIVEILKALMNALKHEYPDVFSSSHPQTLAFFGMDFMVDETGRVWLLECNHGPCFPTDDNHPLQKPLYKNFWRTVVSHFICPESSPVNAPHLTVLAKP